MFSSLVSNIIWTDLVEIWEAFKKIKGEIGALIVFTDTDKSVYKTLTELDTDDSGEYPEFAELNEKIRDCVKRSLDANYCVVVFMSSNKATIRKVPLDPEERNFMLNLKS
jgi:hypothetical protein